jgi:hypothetical protein
MMGGKTKVNKDSFRMTDMEVTIRLRWETSPDMSTSDSKVFLAKAWMNLRVLSWFVKLAKESFFKYCLTSSSLIERGI